MGASGKRFGGSGGPLRGLLEATWRPLEGLWEPGGLQGAAWEPPVAIFTCFYVFWHAFRREPGLHWNGKRVTLESVAGTCRKLLERAGLLQNPGSEFPRHLRGFSRKVTILQFFEDFSRRENDVICILWYLGSLEGLLAAFRSLEGLWEPFGGLWETFWGLWKASWKAAWRPLASKNTCFYVVLLVKHVKNT